MSSRRCESGRKHRHSKKKKEPKEQVLDVEASGETTFGDSESQQSAYQSADQVNNHPNHDTEDNQFSGLGYKDQSHRYQSYPTVGQSPSNIQSYAGYSSQTPSQSSDVAASGTCDIGQAYGDQYQSHQLSQSSNHAQYAPSTIPRTGPGDTMEMPSEGSNSFNATFDATTMAEVTTPGVKKMPKEKAKAVWANRNQVCEKHKRQKKQVR